jgi:hypothetical protein
MCASIQKETVVTDTKHKPDMRNPEMSDARRAAEKKIGEAPFTPEERSIDVSRSTGRQASAEGHTTKP